MTETEEPEQSAEYTVEINNKQYSLNEEARRLIQERAEHEYSANGMFSCWWKVASPDQYEEDNWEENIHDTGDPVLVIETEGVMVPWESLDSLNVEMQEVGPESQLDREMDDDSQDNGNGVRTIDADELDDVEKDVGRTHFSLTPEQFEEVPDPDGEEPDKIPAKPVEMGGEPSLILWLPDHPEIEHTWAAGEAVLPVASRVEWNVQKKADQPRPDGSKGTSHDHWETILKSQDCEVVAELAPSQTPPSGEDSDGSDEDVPEHFKTGKYGGGNWSV